LNIFILIFIFHVIISLGILKVENYGVTSLQKKALVVSPVGTPLKELRELPTDRLIHIFERVIQILRHVHAKGIIHGDISPSNILITKDDQVYVIDWGSALQKETLCQINGTLVSGRAAQTLFCSASTLRGNPATERDDWIALAFSLHHMVGFLPWALLCMSKEMDLFELIYMKSEYKPDASVRNPEIQKYLEDFIEKVKSNSPDLAPLEFTPNSI
jgi:serine/threonine protein kinase